MNADNSQSGAAGANQQVAAQGAPIFTILAGVFVFVCFVTPLILLTIPVMLTLAMSVIAMVRKEKPRWIAPAVLALAIILVLSAGAQLNNITGTSASNLSAAKLDDWSWNADPEFGTNGTIKWRVVVRNTSDRPIRNAKVDFTTYDANNKLLSSTFTYVDAIPAGQTRTDESYADLYGTEATADAVISEVHFGDE